MAGACRRARITATVTAALLLLYLGPRMIWGLRDAGGVFQPEYTVRAILALIASGTDTKPSDDARFPWDPSRVPPRIVSGVISPG
ncbi:hypothetical protein QQY66_37850 [Streptomyces sp. DG2A-72]|uniref:hypothetical protein n=1 Tax=Streptomyces sp. DG2A-72 TaxID=3051386 RepID=UPI00265C61C0|nr:hypothetical protein [Streptomyces sp. DG2A-72]MDO0937206.1 hypothetical protein [Streptomyces sp. DG2A-72]